ncbi:MAG TPA: hypothetical protein PLV68_10495, partial [Ilumatobacteraceae bacterium]|nr:hypothetical protein [Ilumatobacteraceae bacterium]
MPITDLAAPSRRASDTQSLRRGQSRWPWLAGTAAAVVVAVVVTTLVVGSSPGRHVDEPPVTPE